MGSRDGSRDRSRSASRGGDEFPDWDENMQAMFNIAQDLLPDEDVYSLSVVVYKLAKKGCNTILKVKNAPPELLKIYLSRQKRMVLP